MTFAALETGLKWIVNGVTDPEPLGARAKSHGILGLYTAQQQMAEQLKAGPMIRLLKSRPYPKPAAVVPPQGRPADETSNS